MTARYSRLLPAVDTGQITHIQRRRNIRCAEPVLEPIDLASPNDCRCLDAGHGQVAGAFRSFNPLNMGDVLSDHHGSRCEVTLLQEEFEDDLQHPDSGIGCEFVFGQVGHGFAHADEFGCFGMSFDAEIMKQLDDFPICLGRRDIFETACQATLCNVHGVRRIGASLDQFADNPLVAMYDRAD
jgi:hypothetical protein